MGNTCHRNHCAKCGDICIDTMSCRVHRKLGSTGVCLDCDNKLDTYIGNCNHRNRSTLSSIIKISDNDRIELIDYSNKVPHRRSRRTLPKTKRASYYKYE